MNGILAFLRRTYLFLTFLLLQGISLFLVFNYNVAQKSFFDNLYTEVNGNIDALFYNVTSYFNLKRVNETLVEDYGKLKSELLFYHYLDTSTINNIKDTSLNRIYKVTPYRVVNNSVQLTKNFIILKNKKGQEKPSPETPVIDSRGVVGFVVNSSKNFSLAMSILNTDFRLNAEISELGESGFIKWDGINTDFVLLTDISNRILIEKGMRVTTGKFSKKFPYGILIGTIEEYEVKPGEGFYTIKVKLASDIKNLEYAFLIDDIYKPEIDSLINTVKK
jgi:rod shape-determining protein MreC